MLQVLYNYGMAGTTSRILAAASQGIESLSGAGGSSALVAASSSEVRDLKDGVVEGGKAIARGFLNGLAGIVTKPMEGAKAGGAAGFFGGVAKGVVGVATAPVSAALAAASKVSEGFDATMHTLRSQVGGSGDRTDRRRLPRTVTGDRLVRPFDFHSALGQALMHNCALAAPQQGLSAAALPELLLGSGGVLGGGRAAGILGRPGGELDFRQDLYEAHCVLPSYYVVLITNRRLMLARSPELVAIEAKVMASGEETVVVNEPPVGQALWQVRWEDLLTVELAFHQQVYGLQPDAVLVHRKHKSVVDESLIYEVPCQPGGTQARDLLQAIQAAWFKYYSQPRAAMMGLQALVGSLSLQAGAAPAGPADAAQALPNIVPSLQFSRLWAARLQSGQGKSVFYAVWFCAADAVGDGGMGGWTLNTWSKCSALEMPCCLLTRSALSPSPRPPSFLSSFAPPALLPQSCHCGAQSRRTAATSALATWQSWARARLRSRSSCSVTLRARSRRTRQGGATPRCCRPSRTS